VKAWRDRVHQYLTSAGKCIFTDNQSKHKRPEGHKRRPQFDTDNTKCKHDKKQSDIPPLWNYPQHKARLEYHRADDGDAVTLRVLTHQAGMDVRLFSQRPPGLLDNLFPEMNEGMDESSYNGRGGSFQFSSIAEDDNYL
jgi:hypothetical protein